MQDSLERLYQCFLRASQFAQSCAVYQQISEKEKYPKEAKMFGTLAVQYSQKARDLLGFLQDVKDQNRVDEVEIAVEFASFAGISDTMENINTTSRNLQQFVEEYLPECADICA